ncbi:hypothetical protein [Paraburkholderia tuberum]|uniref:hypothetical protein n=1 Tax=Paraburkholderia tuberum TaxID=157910 RepID=UPI000B831CF7|nr:hypothetical protein [Paraburkholderia tuberum]
MKIISRAYLSDEARTGAEKKDFRLATFVPAGLLEYAELPHRVLDTLFLFLGTSAVWSISLLVSAGVKYYAL